MNKFTSYLVVGGAAFFIEYISFLVIYALVPVTPVAQTASFGIGLLVSFTGNRRYTFNGLNPTKKFAHSTRMQAARYVILGIFNIIVTNVLIYWQIDILSIEPLIAKILTMVLVVVWNFIIFNKVIFKA